MANTLTKFGVTGRQGEQFVPLIGSIRLNRVGRGDEATALNRLHRPQANPVIRIRNEVSGLPVPVRGQVAASLISLLPRNLKTRILIGHLRDMVTQGDGIAIAAVRSLAQEAGSVEKKVLGANHPLASIAGSRKGDPMLALLMETLEEHRRHSIEELNEIVTE